MAVFKRNRLRPPEIDGRRNASPTARETQAERTMIGFGLSAQDRREAKRLPYRSGDTGGFSQKSKVGTTSHDVLPPRSFRACRGILWGDVVKNAGKQFVCQVVKCGICIFDQCIFFISRPGFQLLFSFYGFKWGFICFIIHQFMHMVFLCKTIDARMLVFV